MNKITDNVSLERVFTALCFCSILVYSWGQLWLANQPISYTQFNLLILSLVLLLLVTSRRSRKTLPKM